ncbi:MAG: cytochrome c biogenesis protein CcsA, partial [Flavobacteriales bacterium]
IAFVQSLRVLRTSDLDADRMALAAVHASLLFASLGLITGATWARATWGDWWTTDPKLNGAAVTVLIYAAYLILRGSIPDGHKRARLAAIYNIFAYVLMLVFIMVLPRLTDSLHPGNGGNPAFSSYDLDSTLRAVFYPAVTGWVVLGVWVYTLNLRVARLKELSDEANDG